MSLCGFIILLVFATGATDCFPFSLPVDGRIPSILYLVVEH